MAFMMGLFALQVGGSVAAGGYNAYTAKKAACEKENNLIDGYKKFYTTAIEGLNASSGESDLYRTEIVKQMMNISKIKQDVVTARANFKQTYLQAKILGVLMTFTIFIALLLKHFKLFTLTPSIPKVK
jgi:hypothetical protein